VKPFALIRAEPPTINIKRGNARRALNAERAHAAALLSPRAHFHPHFFSTLLLQYCQISI
jgi:hypothetical protein